MTSFGGLVLAEKAAGRRGRWRTLAGVTADFTQQIWVATLQGNLTAPPVVTAAGIIYAVGEDGVLYAIQPPGERSPPAKSSWPMFRANARHTGRVGNPAAK